MSDPAEVTLADAYAEACAALGETIVQQRLMGKELDRLTRENEILQARADA